MFWKKVLQKIRTHILCPITFFQNCAVYGIMWKNVIQPERPQISINMGHGYCILDN
jgi:hypothetical protein